MRSFSGLLVDYSYEQNISIIVKGVRNNTDFDYENTLHQVGESQKLGIDTFLLFARPELAHVSSGAVKGIQKEHGFINEYVPLNVKQALELRMAKQFIIGVTGEIGVGKSYVSDFIVATSRKMRLSAHNIDIDKIGHQILEELTEPKYQEVRNQVIQRFGKNVGLPNGLIDRKRLGQIVFNSPTDLHDLNHIMLNPILVRLKRELADKSGILILNGALLAEAGIMNLCNNHIVLVKCDRKVREDRLVQRGLSKSQIHRRIRSQYSYSKKKEIITAQLQKDLYGKLWEINSSAIIDKKHIADICSHAKAFLDRE